MQDLTRKMSRKEHALLTDEQKKARRKAKVKATNKAYNAKPENKDKTKARDKARQSNPEYKARRRELQGLRRKTPEGRAKKKALWEAYSAKPEIKAKIKVYNKAYRASKKTHYVLYKHTNSEGQIYVGCGWNTRPFELRASRRSPDWNKAFLGASICIEILDTFNTKKEARNAERELIQAIGLDNLVNMIN